LTLIYLSAAWVAGILLGFELDLHPALIAGGLLPLPLLFFRKYAKPIILTSLCLLAFFGGAFYAQSSLPADSADHLSFYNDSGTLVIQGIVSQDPDVRDSNARLRLSGIEIDTGGGWRAVEGDALVFVQRYPQYSYGDLLRISGELETPPQLEDFDYADYLSHEGIYATILYPQIEITATGQGYPPLQWLHSLRSNMAHTLSQVLPEPQASLAQGIVLGIRGNIPSGVQEAFSQTGTAHLLAISGLHLGIVAGLMLAIGIRLFGRRYYLYVWLALITIWLYALLSGMHPPVIRGAIMASVFLTAELLGRQRSAFTALAFAAAVMVGLNPQILFTASFQMSFLAMAGIITIYPRLRGWGDNILAARLEKHPLAFKFAGFINDGFCLTLAAVIAVWPVVAYHFGIVSLVSLPATLLCLPVLPVIITIGGLTAGLGMIALPVAQISGWLAWLFLSYLLLVVNFFAALPFSHIEFGSFGAPLAWAYYIVLAAGLWLATNHRRLSGIKSKTAAIARPIIDSSGFIPRIPKKWLITPLVLVAILTITAVAVKPDDRLHVSFLNVGQGDAILIQKGDYQILIDGGPSPQAVCLEIGDSMPFWDRTIELVVLTHPHDDHLCGLVEVLDTYSVEQVLTPGCECDTPLYNEWLALIEAKDIKCTDACAGQRMEFGGVVIEVLNPQQTFFTDTESDIDNNGVVLYVSFNDISFLLTGDLMWQGEFELISQRLVPQCTVLKIGHHGSNTSTTAEFLAAVAPLLAVISADPAEYGHPHPEVMARLEAQLGAENIYLTDEDGTIEFITDGTKLWLETEK